MKQIRKLHVRTGQELSAFAQDQVMAGGNSNWTGVCRCSEIGNTHNESRVVTYSDPNWGDIAGGVGYTLLGGLATYASNGVLGFVGGPLIYAGIDQAYSGATHQSQITYHRTMKLTSKSPKTHSVLKTWTT